MSANKASMKKATTSKKAAKSAKKTATKKAPAKKATASKKAAKPIKKAAAKKASLAKKAASKEALPMSALGFFIQTYSRI